MKASKGRRPGDRARREAVGVIKRAAGSTSASLIQRGDGRLVARVKWADGGWRHFYGRDVEAITARVVAAAKAPLQPAVTPSVTPPQLTLGAYLEDWVATLPGLVTSGKLKPSTADFYTRYARRHLISDAVARMPLSALEAADLADLYRRKEEEGLSGTTVHHLAAVLHRALGRAQRRRLAPRNAAAEVDRDDRPRARSGEMHVLAGGDLRRFLDAVRGERLEALFVVSILEGLRQGEALGLRWQDVDLDRGTLSVRGSLQGIGRANLHIAPPKTARSRRSLDLFPKTVAALRRWSDQQKEERTRVGSMWRAVPRHPGQNGRRALAEQWRAVPQDLVFTTEFGDFLSTTTLCRELDRVLRSAALADIRWHDLRHSAATFWFGGGMHVKVASERLGHASVGITLDRYSHVVPGMQADAVAAVAASAWAVGG